MNPDGGHSCNEVFLIFSRLRNRAVPWGVYQQRSPPVDSHCFPFIPSDISRINVWLVVLLFCYFTALYQFLKSNGLLIVNDDLERMWKEAVVTCSSTYPSTWLEGQRTATENLRRVGRRVEIRTRDSLRTKQE